MRTRFPIPRSKPFPKEETRKALIESLPENDADSSLPRAPFTYVPLSHARALDPDNTIVEGIRGAGKSFWWKALNSEEHRRFIASAFQVRMGSNVKTSQGFGTQLAPSKAPSKDVLAQLSESYAPRHIWRAVVATHANFPAPFPESQKWAEKVEWVAKHPEEYENLLYQVDEALARGGELLLILFDALDRLADDWQGIRPLARALFQVALDMRGCRCIRLKLFVRPDMLEDKGIQDFPDASKLLARKVSLKWPRADLYALLFQCLGNAPTSGDAFRQHCSSSFQLKWEKSAESDDWILPRALRMNEDIQKEVFHSIAGPAMSSGPTGHKRGFPYTWLPNHLLDGLDQVSPRSFCAALRKAAEYENPEDWNYPLHFKAIQAGVQEASSIRTNEIAREDYPWVISLMEPLRSKLTVPCEAEDMFALWKESGTFDKLRELADQEDRVKLPPQHLDEGGQGLLTDMQELGLIQRMTDGRIQMPDVYRIAFGLGRRGGVKPLK